MQAQSVEAAVDPKNRITFLLDWEITLKCNLDCDYCTVGLYGGHDNTQRHPALDKCLAALDFMYAYVDQYMQDRVDSLKWVVLNVYGGEALFHPDIVTILEQARLRHQPYQDRWGLRISTTTNAIVPEKKWQEIIPLVDEFTCSWHSQNRQRDREKFYSNVLALKAAEKNCRVVILMHSDPVLFQDSQAQMAWCQQNGIAYITRDLDHQDNSQFQYDRDQVIWLKQQWDQRSHGVSSDLEVTDQQDLSAQGRACCGGRSLCVNQDHSQRHYWINNHFRDWHCAVNHFFLHVKQTTGEVFVNKDCLMMLDGGTGPIGWLHDTQGLLEDLQKRLAQGMPLIRCEKNRCHCGLCAPKAQNFDTLISMMEKYYK